MDNSNCPWEWVFSKGTVMKIGGTILPSKLPDTYTIELEYEGSKYEINDKGIFDIKRVYNIHI